uniref:Uncharacterized protein n=1 Tax=Haptolina ericina TaxID=156174 RepID=A0A7S3BD26_9EUKA
MVEDANRKQSACRDEPPPLCRLPAFGIEQLLWMALNLVDDAHQQPMVPESDLRVLGMRGVGFSIRLDTNLPAQQPEREALRQRLERDLKEVLPHASIQALHGGSVVLMCWCPASVMDVLAVLPAGLVTLTNQLETEGATFAGYRVLRFPDGSPSPRVDCYDMEVHGSPEAAQALHLVERQLNALTNSSGSAAGGLALLAHQGSEAQEQPVDRYRSMGSHEAETSRSRTQTLDSAYESMLPHAPQGHGSRAGRGASAKLIDFLFNPKTWRDSPDKLPHEERGKQGEKTGGHFLWLVRQVRRLAENETPEWYRKVETREMKDTACVRGYRKQLLDRVPAYDENSEEYLKFRELITKIRADLDEAYQRRPKRTRKVVSTNEIHIVGAPSSKRACVSAQDVVAVRPPVQLGHADMVQTFKSVDELRGYTILGQQQQQQSFRSLASGSGSSRGGRNPGHRSLSAYAVQASAANPQDNWRMLIEAATEELVKAEEEEEQEGDISEDQ